MAELLKSGATMTNLSCPNCGSPLFRLKNGDIWCENDQKKVLIIKEGEEAALAKSTALTSLEATLTDKIKELQKKIENEQDPDELEKLSGTLAKLLENLEKTRKIRRT